MVPLTMCDTVWRTSTGIVSTALCHSKVRLTMPCWNAYYVVHHLWHAEIDSKLAAV